MAQRVLVVDAPDAVRRARVAARDGLDEETIERIFAAQATRDERLGWADEVIVNGGALDALDAEVVALHRKYLALADAGGAGPRA